MNYRDRSALYQVAGCLAASGGLLSSGMTVAFPSSAGSFHLPEEASWVGSASHLAMIFGSLAIGPALDTYGRKSGLAVALLIAFLGWSLLSGGGWVVGGRLMTGLSAGLSSAPVSVLIAEISAPRLRAVLTTFKHAAFSLGLFIMYLLGLIFENNWRTGALVPTGLSCFCLMIVIRWVPETTTPDKSRQTYGPFFGALPSREEVRNPFIVMAGLSALKQLSGTTVVLSYASQMLRAGGLKQSGLGAVYLGGVRLIASLLAAPLAARFGRRALACYGGYCSSLVLLVLAGGTSSSLQCLLVFVFSSAIASSAVQALVGEVFIKEFRAVSTGLTTTVTYTAAFIALHSHPWLMSQLGFQKLLGLYACISVLSTLVTIMFLPDNSRNSVDENGTVERMIPLEDTAAFKQSDDVLTKI